MAKATKTDAVWVEIDPATLTSEAALHYKNYKQAYADMKQCRAQFEQCMNAAAGLEEHSKRLVFGYNFGKLSVAVVEAEAVKAKPKAAGSLSDYLAGMKSSGNRC